MKLLKLQVQKGTSDSSNTYYFVCIKAKVSDTNILYNDNDNDNEIELRFSSKSYPNLMYVLMGDWPGYDKLSDYEIWYIPDEKENCKIGYVSNNLNYLYLPRIYKIVKKAKDHQQKIIFGPPGTGKSFSVNAIAKNLGVCKDNRVVTVFHPEYTYGDFIAKLMPLTNAAGGVEYKVVAGHFIKALAKALKEPTKNVLLQIDEINRGNCAAIFGDIFQLLDRNSSGESSYRVHLSELALRALAQEIVGKDAVETEIVAEINNHISGVRIPSNLSIIATMNTSDESVYFMDSAFKRRWQFQYISADTYEFKDNNEPVTELNSANNDVKEQAEAKIEKSNDVTWDELRRSINNFLICNASTIRGIEDKQIGLWFIKAQADKTISQQDIQYKLMHYLWDNVFARDKKPLLTLLNKKTTELATFGLFVKFKDDFVREVKAYKDNSPCPTEAPSHPKA